MDTLKKRLASSVIGIVLLLLLLLSKGIIMNIALLLLAFVAVHEFNSAFKNAGHKPNLFMGFLFVTGVIILTVRGSVLQIEDKLHFSLLIFAIATLFGYLALFIFLVGHRDPIDLMINMFEMVYIGIPISMFIVMSKSSIIYMVLIIAFGNDTSAYFIGKMFGRHKLAPSISPKKTIEGSIGGIVGTVLLVMIGMQFFYPKPSISVQIILGVGGSVLAQMGDLTASIIKRYCNIKDFGKIMPGHGGLLDRLDSIIFVIPAVFLIFIAYGA